MELNELILIKTDIGKIPVIIKQININCFVGKNFNNPNISVLSGNKKECIKNLIIENNNYFNMWLKNQLSGLNLFYGKK